MSTKRMLLGMMMAASGGALSVDWSTYDGSLNGTVSSFWWPQGGMWGSGVYLPADGVVVAAGALTSPTTAHFGAMSVSGTTVGGGFAQIVTPSFGQFGAPNGAIADGRDTAMVLIGGPGGIVVASYNPSSSSTGLSIRTGQIPVWNSDNSTDGQVCGACINKSTAILGQVADDGTVRAVVGTFTLGSDATPTFGAQTTLNAGGYGGIQGGPALCRMSDTTALMVYTATFSREVKAHILTQSGTNVLDGGVNTLFTKDSPSAGGGFHYLARLDASTALLVYNEVNSNDSAWNVKVRVLSIAGNTVTTGSATLLVTDALSNMPAAVVSPTDGQACLIYHSGTQFVSRGAKISGGSLTLGMAYIPTMASDIARIHATVIDAQRVLVAVKSGSAVNWRVLKSM